MSLSYSPHPLYITRSEGQFFYDENDHRYLDCINNVTHIGHCHPYFVQQVSNQLATLNTNSRFLYDSLITSTEKLLSLMPPELCVVTWANSGSEANDLAMQMARVITQKDDFVCLEGAYHGHTHLTMDVSPYKWNNLYRKPKHVIIADSPCTYRGKYRDDPDSSQKYAQDLGNRIDKKGKKVAGIIVESMQSCAGQIVPKRDYYTEIQNVIRERGGLFIADEVQTGFGRTGENFWAFQHYGIKPDIVTCGKAMGNGYPVSAVICTAEVADAFHKRGIEYFNTYGANPVACTAAEAVMDIIREDDLQGNASRVGNYLNERLTELLNYKFVGDIRGMGFFQGIDIVKSKRTRKPAPDLAQDIRIQARLNGVLVSVDGVDRNVIKIKPPMVFNNENVDGLMNVLHSIMKKVSMKSKATLPME